MVAIGFRVGMNGDDPNIYRHVVSQILIPCYEGGAMLILEADPAGSAVIDTVKILDGRDDRIGGIMRVDLDTHGDSGADLGVFIE